MKTCKQLAREWSLSEKTINDLCKKGKISGAIKVGRIWQIPDNAEKPVDGRVSSGKYAKASFRDLRLVKGQYIAVLHGPFLCKLKRFLLRLISQYGIPGSVKSHAAQKFCSVIQG